MNWMINWFKRNIKAITAWPAHEKIGKPLSITGVIIGAILALIFSQWWLFLCVFSFYIGALWGFEGKQADWEQGWVKIKFWLNNKVIDSCGDVTVGSWIITLATIAVIIWLL